MTENINFRCVKNKTHYAQISEGGNTLSAEMFGTEHISYRCCKKQKDLHMYGNNLRKEHICADLFRETYICTDVFQKTYFVLSCFKKNILCADVFGEKHIMCICVSRKNILCADVYREKQIMCRCVSRKTYCVQVCFAFSIGSKQFSTSLLLAASERKNFPGSLKQ